MSSSSSPASSENPQGVDGGAAVQAREIDPFELTGLEWKRVSPRLRFARLFVWSLTIGMLAVAGVVVAVIVGNASGQLWVYVLVAALVVFFVIGLFVIPRQVRAIGYAERADDLFVRSGIMFRTLHVVPYGRMQFVDVKAGPLDRKLSIATVQLHTASPATDAAIPGLDPAEARRLRDRLTARGAAQLAGL